MLYIKTFLFVLIPVSFLYSQPAYQSGYLILQSDDTIYGMVNVRNPYFMNRKCIFKAGDSTTTYAAGEIKKYGIAGVGYYETKDYKGEKIFFECLVYGKLSVYTYRDFAADRYFIEKDHKNLNELLFSEEIIHKQLYSIRITTKDYLPVVAKYTWEYPQLHKNIEVPSHRSLIKYAKKYNRQFAEKENQTSYYKEMPINLIIEPAWSLFHSTFQSIETKRFLLNFYFPLSQLNNKLFIKTGYMTHNETVNGYKLRETKIPVQLQYSFPFRRISPKIGIGNNLWFVQVKDNNYKKNKSLICFVSTNFYTGIDIQLHKWVSLVSTFGADYSFADTKDKIRYKKRFWNTSLGMAIKI